MTETCLKKMNICLVEDDLGDAKAIRRAIAKAEVANVIVHARDGVEALEILRSADNPLPTRCLVLLDLNMPRMNGIEFLKEVRSDSELCQTVVFVLSTSEDRVDVSAAFDQNVAGYFRKTGSQGYLKLVDTLYRYWDLGILPDIPRPQKGE